MITAPQPSDAQQKEFMERSGKVFCGLPRIIHEVFDYRVNCGIIRNVMNNAGLLLSGQPAVYHPRANNRLQLWRIAG